MRCLLRRQQPSAVARCFLPSHTSSLLCVTRFLLTDKGRRDGADEDACSATACSDSGQVDETLELNIYRPDDQQDPQLHSATERFIRTIITTSDEQEWRDMLAAAIRLNTLREHHLRAVIRGVHQSKYDVVATVKRSRVAKSPSHCTPSTRLQRAVGVVQMAVEEGYRVAAESVHTLVVFLLRAAAADKGAHTSGGNSESCSFDHECPTQLAHTTRAAVWHFLSWMERHDYHIMSTAVLEMLENIITDETATGESCSVQHNRLVYVRGERERLLSGPSRLMGWSVGRYVPIEAAPDDDRK
ncbi:hypothetical protein ERJ75_000823600 [Trypanosoma vivax]|uniref:Uncharacterized protein n=1 Tax=Trypanosoma vivax (strain Y486) TaxID=1055687 RepID=G0UBG7_TRYVY|nr:hypothetical protein TRVL_01974 [Trypanosoma vivax]KAH8613097.1 hypothetical protein ERJ75_000823600 [Trypanosoma vivax]CCC53163.1 conserved hypothetical protein [Trypanosoma vivax Y486]